MVGAANRQHGDTASSLVDAELHGLSTPRLMAAAERELASDARKTFTLATSSDEDEADRLIAEEMRSVGEGSTAPAARPGFDTAAYQRPVPADLAASGGGPPREMRSRHPPQQQFEELTLDDNDEALIAEIAGEA